jgi:hypothetical protein
MQAVAQKVLGWMRNSLLSAVLQEWVAQAEERRRLRSVAQRVLGRMWNSLLGGSWAVLEAWVALVMERRRLRAVAQRVLGRLRNGLLSAALHQWAAQAARAQGRLRRR